MAHSILKARFLRPALSLLLFLAFLSCTMLPFAHAGGGTNGILRRMETMVSQLESSGEMSTEEAEKMRKQIDTLRDHVDERVEENGGWLNTQHDKDIYAEIDQYNKPLFQRYQNSEAKNSSQSSTLGISPNDKNYRGRHK